MQNEGKLVVLTILWLQMGGLRIRPFTNDLTITDETAFADLEGTDRAASETNAPWQQPFLSDNEGVMVTNPVTLSQWSGPFPFTVYGYALIYDQTNLVRAIKFAEPIVITTADQEITRDFTMRIPASA